MSHLYRFVLAVFLISIGMAFSVLAEESLPDEWLIIDNAQVIDGLGNAPVNGKTLYIHNGRFVASDKSKKGDMVSHLDVTGKTIIPGLIDGHVHMSGGNHFADRARDNFNRLIRGGVTGVRDMAGDTRALTGISRSIIDGDVKAPVFRYSTILAGPGFFKDPRAISNARGYKIGTAPYGQAITKETNLPLAVALAKGTGAAAIKIYANMESDLASALIKTAHDQDMLVYVHATLFPAKPSDLVNAGADVLSHSMYLIWEAVNDIGDSYTVRAQGPFDSVPFNHPKIVSLLKLMAEKNTLLDETLYLNFEDENAARGQWAYDITRLAHELGVPLVAGTDGMFPRDPKELPNIHLEMELLVTKSGLTPLEAIKAATYNGARSMAIENDYGSIEPGKIADFIVLNESPEKEILNTREIFMVFKDGKHYQ
jgi:imidazolonepropionase-like amidohydrolase